MTSLKFSRGGSHETTSKFHISVVGACANEPLDSHFSKDRSNNDLYRGHESSETGPGKSCLCSRLVRPAEDDYQPGEHVSVLSAADYSTTPINNDHFLYWGEARRTSDDGHDCIFSVIEQTEFIDDSNFQPFRNGKGDRDYVKRVTNTKISSPGKIQYFGKSQLGIENEYPVIPMPDGRFSVDGFICTFDVSSSTKKQPTRQVETVFQILCQIVRQKKPVVLVTTKTDESSQANSADAIKLLHRKELKGCVQLVETSAHKNVNVDAAFMLLAQLIERTSGHTQLIRYRLQSYEDAASMRKERMDTAAKAFEALVRTQIKDRRMTWQEAVRRFENDQDFKFYCELWGTESARRVFSKSIHQLRDREAQNRLGIYLARLDRIFHELLPSLSLVNSGWQNCLDYLQSLTVYDSCFADLDPSENVTSGPINFLDDDRFYDSDDTGVPSRILATTDAERRFNIYADSLRREDRRLRLRNQFITLLTETPYALPGRTFRDVCVFLASEPSYNELNELSAGEKQEIYECHQQKVIEDAKESFIELLLENVDLFVKQRQEGGKQRKRKKEAESRDRGAVKGDKHDEDLGEIEHILRGNRRYRAMDLLAGVRDAIIHRMWASLQSPRPENCGERYGCFDADVKSLIQRNVRAAANLPAFTHCAILTSDAALLKLVVLGKNELADNFCRGIRAACGDDELRLDGCLYSIDFRIINGDLSLPQNAFQTSNYIPHGCFCVYDSKETFHYVRTSMENAMLKELARKEHNGENVYQNGACITPCNGLSTVIVFQPRDNLKDSEVVRLRETGQDLACNLQCAFVELPRTTVKSENTMTGSLSGDGKEDVLMRHLNALIRDIQARSNMARSITDAAPAADLFDCDMRVRICIMCGDHLGVFALHILNPLISHTICYRHAKNPQGFLIESYLSEDSKIRTEVDCKSYHETLRALHPANLDEEGIKKNIDGYVMVVDLKRKASYASMRCLIDVLMGQNILRPMMVICVMDHANGPSRDEKQILTEAETVCHERGALFVLTHISDSMSIATYTQLLRNSWEYKVTAYDRASTATLSSTIPSLSDEEAALIKSRSLEREKHTEVLQQHSARSLANHHHLYRDNTGALSLDSPTFTTFGFDRESTRGRADATSDDLLAPISRLTLTAPAPSPLRVTRSTEDMLAPSNGHGHLMSSPTASSGLSPTNNRDYQQAHDDLLRPSQLRGQRKHTPTETGAGSMESLALESSRDSMQGGSARGTGSTVSAAGNVHSAKLKLAARFSVTRSSSALSVTSPVSDESKRVFHPFRKGFAAWQARSADESVNEREKSAAQRLVGRLSAGGKYQHFMDQLNANISRGTQPSPTAPLALPELVEDHEPREESGDENIAVSASPGSDRQFLLGLRKKAVRQPDKTGMRKVAGPTLLPSQHLSLSQDDGDIIYPARSSLPEFVARHARNLKNIASPLEDNVFFPSSADEPSGSHSDHTKNGIKPVKTSKPKREKENKSTKKSKEKKQKKAENTFESFAQSPDNPIPLFVEMCTKFIENKGVETEGIYRVSGSRVHADQLLSKFISNPSSVDLVAMDIPIYNVTTALKTYLVDHTPPVIPQSFVDELQELNFTKDKADRIHLIKTALARLSAAHYQLLKFLFAHLRSATSPSRSSPIRRTPSDPGPNVMGGKGRFPPPGRRHPKELKAGSIGEIRKVSENSRKNKMDVNNLTVCLWPTLYPMEFPSDMARFELIRVGISEILATMISDYDKIFEPNYSPLPLATSPNHMGSLAQEAAEAARLRGTRNGVGPSQISPQRASAATLPHVPPPVSSTSSSSSLEAPSSASSTAPLVKGPVLASLKSVQV